MKASTLSSWLLLIAGILIYAIGLWRACPLLSGKGYFLGVLMTGMFVTYVYLREESFGRVGERFASVCQMVALVTVGLLFVGVVNAPLSLIERMVYPVAFFLSLIGQVSLFRLSKKE